MNRNRMNLIISSLALGRTDFADEEEMKDFAQIVYKLADIVDQTESLLEKYNIGHPPCTV